MRTTLRIASYILLGCVPIFAADFSRYVARGERALKARQFEEAAAVFTEALNLARQEKNTVWESKCQFYLGRVREEQAAAAKSPEGAEQARQQAIRYYKESIRVRPTAAASNNLALLYGKREDQSEVPRLYEQAIQLGGDKKSFYELNYADFLLESGRVGDALRHYRSAAEAFPNDAAIHDRVITLYREIDPTGGVSYLWSLVSHGQVMRPLYGALAFLETGKVTEARPMNCSQSWR